MRTARLPNVRGGEWVGWAGSGDGAGAGDGKVQYIMCNGHMGTPCEQTYTHTHTHMAENSTFPHTFAGKR